MRVDGRFVPRVLRVRLAAERDGRARQRERGRRLLGAVILGTLVVVPGLGCLVGAGLGAVGSAPFGGKAAILAAISGGAVGGGLGLVACLGEALTLGIVVGIRRSMSRAAYERVQEQLSFVVALLDALQDDLHLARKVALKLDTEGLVERKRTSTGRSPHGNVKARYQDEWLELRFVGVDGTAYRLRMAADVKTKYTNDVIQKVKRRMDLRIRPPRDGVRARTFDPNDLEDAARDAVRAAFHDPPEKLRVRATAGAGEARIAVMQQDAAIFPDEVVELAAAALTATRAR